MARNLSSHAEELLISASRGQPLVGAISQQDLVQRMERAGLLTDRKSIQAMTDICRSNFVTAKSKVLVFGGNEEERDADPYENKPQPLGHGATISTPQFHAEVLSALSASLASGTSALDIGTGTGYMACVFAKMVGASGMVKAVDCIEPLIEVARVTTNKIAQDDMAPMEFGVVDGLHLQENHKPSFHSIYCAPAVSSPLQVKNLCRLLHVGGTMVVPLENVWTGHQRLLKVTKKNSENETKQEDIGPVACQPVLEGDNLTKARQPPPPKPLTRTEELALVQEELADWTQSFQLEHGRRPTREDLKQDAIGGPLFEKFSRASKIGSVHVTKD
jgi:protein-L-isoaspartate(D-aspartate) O-methyltransferase